MLLILGRNRVTLLAVLAVLNIVSAYAVYQYIGPMRVTSDSELSKAKNALEAKRAEIKKLKEEYALLQNQLEYFKDLEARGFFNDQNRVAAQESFEKLRTISGVLRARYNIAAGELIEDPRAVDANYVVLKSPIVVDLDSIDDIDVYSFLKLIQDRFPGKVDIASMEITKSNEISAETLKKIGEGTPVPLVTSKFEFEWTTMADRKTLFPEGTMEPSAAETNGGASQIPSGVTP